MFGTNFVTVLWLVDADGLMSDDVVYRLKSVVHAYSVDRLRGIVNGSPKLLANLFPFALSDSRCEIALARYHIRPSCTSRGCHLCVFSCKGSTNNHLVLRDEARWVLAGAWFELQKISCYLHQQVRATGSRQDAESPSKKDVMKFHFSLCITSVSRSILFVIAHVWNNEANTRNSKQ